MLLSRKQTIINTITVLNGRLVIHNNLMDDHDFEKTLDQLIHECIAAKSRPQIIIDDGDDEDL